MLIRHSQLRAISLFALLITLYLGMMAVTHESSFDGDYHHDHQCEMYSGLQQGLVSNPTLPQLFPLTTPAFKQTTPSFYANSPTNLRARSPPAFLRTLT
jgi:hypothetical protein